jgi:hypothetical protein
MEKTEMTAKNEKRAAVPEPKKSYTRPQLQVYGDVQEISLSVNSAILSHTDGGNPNHSQTH